LQLKANIEMPDSTGATPWVSVCREAATNADPRSEAFLHPDLEKTVELLVKAGCKQDAMDDSALTGWHHACSRCAVGAISLLAKHGAQPDVQVGWRRQELQLDEVPLEEEPLDFKYGDTGFMLACLRLCTTNSERRRGVLAGQLKSLSVLVESKCDLEARNGDGDTAFLMVCMLHEQTSIVASTAKARSIPL